MTFLIALLLCACPQAPKAPPDEQALAAQEEPAPQEPSGTDDNAALEDLVAQCSRSAGACVELGDRLREQGRYKDAFERFHQACIQGEPKGCSEQGLLYQDGLGVPRNLERAKGLYRESCEAGAARGCSRLGSLYLRGVGVERDPEQALAYSQQGCDRGDAMGCANLGLMHERGDGLPKDTKQASMLYARACSADLGFGCTRLGALYARGEGPSPDPRLALIYSKKGCSLGDDLPTRSDDHALADHVEAFLAPRLRGPGDPAGVLIRAGLHA